MAFLRRVLRVENRILQGLRVPCTSLPLSLRVGAAGCRTSQVPYPSLPLPVRFPGGCGFQPRPFPFTSAPAGRTATCHLSLFTCHSRRRRVPFAFFAFSSCASLAPKIFSNHWKTPEKFFQSLEKSARFFPTIGKKFSNHWKTFPAPAGRAPHLFTFLFSLFTPEMRPSP